MSDQARDGANEIEAAIDRIVAGLRTGASEAARKDLRGLLRDHGAAGVRRARARANGLVMNEGAWLLAHPIYKELAPSDPKSRPLRRRAKWVCRHSDAFERVFAREAHAARILKHIRQTYPEAAAVRRAPAGGGLNTAASYRHQVLDPSGDPCATLFEKVYVGRAPAGFRRVHALHSRVGSTPGFAPTYFGALRAAPFASTLHEAIDGDVPPPNIWPKAQRKLLRDLWAPEHASSGSAAGTVSAVLGNTLARYAGWGTAAGTAWQWTPRTLREIPTFLAGRQIPVRLGAHLNGDRLDQLQAAQGSIRARLAAMPHFVMHGDLHRTQVLRDIKRARYVLIDWDRWSLEPLGAGWPLPTGSTSNDAPGARPPAVPPRLAAIAEQQGVAPADAMLAAIMWALGRAGTHGDSVTVRQLADWALAFGAR